MPEYNISFSEKLLEAAKYIDSGLDDSVDAQRTVLYLSLLASEIALKALLESAGLPLEEIIKLSHDHSKLLAAICQCEVKVNSNLSGSRLSSTWLSASRLLSQTVHANDVKTTVGQMLSLENQGASVYPGEIRYGKLLVHAPASAMLCTSQTVAVWVKSHLNMVRMAERSPSAFANEDKTIQKRTKLRKREVEKAIMEFCESYPFNIQLGSELLFTQTDCNNRSQDYCIGYKLTGESVNDWGEISVGYARVWPNFRLHGSVIIDDEVIFSVSKIVDEISQHNQEKHDQPKELKTLLFDLAFAAKKKYSR